MDRVEVENPRRKNEHIKEENNKEIKKSEKEKNSDQAKQRMQKVREWHRTFLIHKSFVGKYFHDRLNINVNNSNKLLIDNYATNSQVFQNK